MPAPRPPTHDEKKAAGAAFRGTPFRPTWSDQAGVVYDGIARAMAKRSGELHVVALPEPEGEPETEAALRYGIMKPRVTKLAGVPSTALICCPQCFRLISYEAGEAVVVCHACCTTVRNQDLPTLLNPDLCPD